MSGGGGALLYARRRGAVRAAPARGGTRGVQGRRGLDICMRALYQGWRRVPRPSDLVAERGTKQGGGRVSTGRTVPLLILLSVLARLVSVCRLVASAADAGELPRSPTAALLTLASAHCGATLVAGDESRPTTASAPTTAAVMLPMRNSFCAREKRSPSNGSSEARTRAPSSGKSS